MKPAGKTPKKKGPSRPASTEAQDPVEVYCRIRPLHNPTDVPVVRVIDNKIVQLEPQETNGQSRNIQKQVSQSRRLLVQYRYTFKCVFDTDASQQELFEHVGLPLVSDLLHGKPGLLFTYGITSSGKTYTMTGHPQDGGILPRCLDVVFNSIGEYQARKYVFKPDKLNGYDTQTMAEAMAEYQQDIMPHTPKPPKIRRRDDDGVDWTSRTHETAKVDDVDADMAYAVFVSYIEIYNNYVYDLLEDNPIDPVKTKQLQSKMLREDSKRCVYAFGVTEVEVKSADEAFDAWCRGQKRKRIAHTALNAESSRSHSIFNIRLVQAPLDAQGLDILQDKNALIISQLSLVDLAGSERTDRTGNTGHRLREAGNINNSLMVLRTCIEILRENQTTGSNKMVPYRDAKITHLFKNFFDGEGKVRMIVCLNPRPDDYDETFHVMKFAEMAQEVLVPCSTPTTPAATLNLRTGRRRPILPRTAKFGGSLKELSTMPPPETPREVIRMPELQNYLLTDPSDGEVLRRMEEWLSQTIMLRKETKASDMALVDDLRRQIIQMEAENGVLKEEHKVLRMDLKAREQQVILLEKKLSNAEQSVQALNLELEGMFRQKKTVENMLDEKQMQLNKEAMEKVQMHHRMQEQIQLERERMKRAMNQLLADKQAELEAKLSVNHEKFRILREVLNGADWDAPEPSAPPAPAESGVTTRSAAASCATGGREMHPRPHPARKERQPQRRHYREMAACMLGQCGVSATGMSSSTSEPRLCGTPKTTMPPVMRHRRSRSSGAEMWVDHKPTGTVDTGSVMQPVMKKKKSVGKLGVKDVTKGASKYALLHQEQDAGGDVEEQLYKGDVIPSMTGGAQVVFSEVETVKHLSPTSSQLRKRSSGRAARDDDEDYVSARCSVSVEGHAHPSVIKRSRV
ncbi:kinesin-like protein KIF23 isoform X2 [Dermacentor albipictus]|uniref:kinesin-like protein KIF23 isoform X2 n=1 Tax=Dermacentor albipictus TaxID=60249 RepID=UPI0031FBB5A1